MNEPVLPAARYLKRFARLLLGLFLYALGSFLTIQANIGLAPWEAFSMGCARFMYLSFGNAVVISGFVILLAALFLKEKIGFGTVLNAILIGKFVDLIQATGLIPVMRHPGAGVALLLLGQVVICLGSYFYIGAELGCGPRDSLMVALSRRFPRVPVGAIRGVLEGVALLVGALLGARVGIGTLISVLGIGVTLQLTFRMLKFDVRQLTHESLGQTVNHWRSGRYRPDSMPVLRLRMPSFFRRP
jgi:uncharacterized membrane protein YczE